MADFENDPDVSPAEQLDYLHTLRERLREVGQLVVAAPSDYTLVLAVQMVGMLAEAADKALLEAIAVNVEEQEREARVRLVFGLT